MTWNRALYWLVVYISCVAAGSLFFYYVFGAKLPLPFFAVLAGFIVLMATVEAVIERARKATAAKDKYKYRARVSDRICIAKEDIPKGTVVGIDRDGLIIPIAKPKRETPPAKPTALSSS